MKPANRHRILLVISQGRIFASVKTKKLRHRHNWYDGHASASDRFDESNSEDSDIGEDEENEDDENESDDQIAAPTAAQTINATKNPVEHLDVQTIFFVDFTPTNLDAEGTEKLDKLVGLDLFNLRGQCEAFD